MNEATIGDGTGVAAKEPLRPDTDRLIASRFFFEYDRTYGEFRKRIHGDNPRYGELRGIVNDPAVPTPGERNPHGRILEACDVYDESFAAKGHSIVTVCGGYNGGGPKTKWCEYLGEIAGAVQRLTDAFGFAWMVRLHDHSDVWYAEIGFNDKRGVPADGSDHVRCFADDEAAYARYREQALKAQKPLGLAEWGFRDYQWIWDRLTEPYGWPRGAMVGQLVCPRNVAHHYAGLSPRQDRIEDYLGVYPAHNGTEAFFALSGTDTTDSAQDLRDLIASYETLDAIPCLEDWAREPGVADVPQT